MSCISPTRTNNKPNTRREVKWDCYSDCSANRLIFLTYKNIAHEQQSFQYSSQLASDGVQHCWESPCYLTWYHFLHLCSCCHLSFDNMTATSPAMPPSVKSRVTHENTRTARKATSGRKVFRILSYSKFTFTLHWIWLLHNFPILRLSKVSLNDEGELGLIRVSRFWRI